MMEEISLKKEDTLYQSCQNKRSWDNPKDGKERMSNS